MNIWSSCLYESCDTYPASLNALKNKPACFQTPRIKAIASLNNKDRKKCLPAQFSGKQPSVTGPDQCKLINGQLRVSKKLAGKERSPRRRKQNRPECTRKRFSQRASGTCQGNRPGKVPAGPSAGGQAPISSIQEQQFGLG